MLRIEADFNSVYGAENGRWVCWCLRYEGNLLEHCSERFNLKVNKPVILFYSDGPEGEEVELDGVLVKGQMVKWEAKYDWSSYRLIRDAKPICETVSRAVPRLLALSK
jgi:hypothetical protein